MYSPKITEELIPCLYRLGKARKIPMTKLVNQLLRKALDAEVEPAMPVESKSTVQELQKAA